MSELIKYKNIDIRPSYTKYDEKINKKEIARECKFVRHLYKTENNDDTHIVVVVHHYDDGSMTKEIMIVPNYKRPVWVTKKIYRQYKDKKEFEKIDRLQLVKCTQSDINNAVLRALEIQPSQYAVATLRDNPYIYGYDVPSTAYINHFFRLSNNNYMSNYKVVNMDLEVDVTGIGDITIITLSTPGMRHTAVSRRLLEKLYSTDEEMITAIKTMSLDLLPKTRTLEMCEVYNVTIHKNDLDMMKYMFGMVHNIMPDFVTFHNMVYDLTVILDRLEYHKTNPTDVLCDPSIPDNIKKVTFRPAKQYKIKKGIKQGIPMEEQWTTIDIQASFMIMDTMTNYAAVRQAQGKVVGGYSLQNLLEKNKLAGKLLYEDETTKYLTKKDWHKYMATKRPLHYIIYAEQDTIAMTELELKTEDFSQSLPIFAGIGDFNRFNSSVHKAACNAYSENRHKGLIVGTAPKNQVDRSYLGTTDWIKALSSNHIQDIGLPVTNLPGLSTNVTAHDDDLDCVSSYPSDIQTCNVSTSTLRAEILTIRDIDKTEFKNNNINLISSNSNTLEYCSNMMNMPKPFELLEEVKKRTIQSSL